MASHPRQRFPEGSNPFSRRTFLTAAGLAGAGLGLAACGNGATSGASSTQSIPLPRVNNPVTWPLSSSNPAIANGRSPESGATLKLYCWVAYVNQKVLNNFAKKYNCQVQVSTFNNTAEAMSKLSSGQMDYDVFFPTIDLIGPLTESGLIRPLNHSYIPNISQAWNAFTNPFYDQQWRYSTPYTIFTTGIGWRKDLVTENPYDMANGWAMPWNAKYKGRVGILDDYREAAALGMLKNHLYDLNTTDLSQMATSTNSLIQLNSLVSTQIDNNDYVNIPSGQAWIHEAWSGDMASSWQYLPKGQSIDTIGYWFPPNGKGPINNDLMVNLKAGQNPVLAHLLINDLLDLNNAIENMSYTGYMQPINGMTPSRLIAEGIIPPNLTSTVVRESDFNNGVRELALDPQVDAQYQQNWLRVSGGI